MLKKKTFDEAAKTSISSKMLVQASKEVQNDEDVEMVCKACFNFFLATEVWGPVKDALLNLLEREKTAEPWINQKESLPSGYVAQTLKKIGFKVKHLRTETQLQKFLANLTPDKTILEHFHLQKAEKQRQELIARKEAQELLNLAAMGEFPLCSAEEKLKLLDKLLQTIPAEAVAFHDQRFNYNFYHPQNNSAPEMSQKYSQYMQGLVNTVKLDGSIANRYLELEYAHIISDPQKIVDLFIATGKGQEIKDIIIKFLYRCSEIDTSQTKIDYQHEAKVWAGNLFAKMELIPEPSEDSSFDEYFSKMIIEDFEKIPVTADSHNLAILKKQHGIQTSSLRYVKEKMTMASDIYDLS